MTLEAGGGSRAMRIGDRNTIVPILVACAAVELVVLLWLLALGRDAFMSFISTPDTSSYVGVAQQLAETHTLTGGPRTLGYPLFLALGYALGGSSYGPYVVIVLQLILNLGLTWICWRLLQRMAPAAGVGLRASATVFCFWAGLGMALFLMTDFLAGACFVLFLYGMLFWRSPSAVFVAGSALAVATLTRPTFTFFPLLLPAAAYIVGRVTSRVPAIHLLAFVAFSLAATGASVFYQYTFNRYLGPSPFLTIPIQEMLYYGTVKDGPSSMDYPAFQKQFAAEVERRAGRPFATLRPGEQETIAKQIFREGLSADPLGIIGNFITNGVKYVFVPIESILARFWTFYVNEQAYVAYVRPIVALLCLPIWLLSLLPPIGSARRHRMYYLLVLGCLLYIVGLSAIGTASGERIRFPVLALMLPVAMWNFQALQSYLPTPLGARGRSETSVAT